MVGFCESLLTQLLTGVSQAGGTPLPDAVYAAHVD